jgi:predicted acyltransferase
VLFSAGFSLVFLALLAWAIDMRGWRWGVTPARIFGNNAILAFALATMLNALEPMLRFHLESHATTIRGAIFGLLADWTSPYNASLGYALLFVALNGVILWPLHRKGIFLRL